MVRTWKLRIILQRMNITYWIYFKEWAKKTTRKRYVHENNRISYRSTSQKNHLLKWNEIRVTWFFLLKENKIAKKVLSFKDQINIFPYLRYHTWKAHILLHVPPNVTLQCQRWIVQRRLSNFQKKISCKNNPLKVKIQRTRVSVKWHCSQTCFMYLLTCYL